MSSKYCHRRRRRHRPRREASCIQYDRLLDIQCTKSDVAAVVSQHAPFVPWDSEWKLIADLGIAPQQSIRCVIFAKLQLEMTDREFLRGPFMDDRPHRLFRSGFSCSEGLFEVSRKSCSCPKFDVQNNCEPLAGIPRKARECNARNQHIPLRAIQGRNGAGGNAIPLH